MTRPEQSPETPPPPAPAAGPVPPRRRESQKDVEKRVFLWVFVLMFATHIFGLIVWLLIRWKGYA